MMFLTSLPSKCCRGGDASERHRIRFDLAAFVSDNSISSRGISFSLVEHVVCLGPTESQVRILSPRLFSKRSPSAECRSAFFQVRESLVRRRCVRFSALMARFSFRVSGLDLLGCYRWHR